MNINEDNELNNYQIMYVTPVEAYTLMESSMDGLSEEQYHIVSKSMVRMRFPKRNKVQCLKN